MCSVCGCGPEGAHFEVHGAKKTGGHDHAAPHSHDHHHGHDHHHHGDGHEHGAEGASLFRAATGGTSQTRLIQIEQDILAKNNAFAAVNRAHLKAHGILALNLLSSPGSGKTTLLVRTIERMKAKHAINVIEGDQQTSADAERIRATGVPALQINTGKGCHLDGHMVGHAIETLRPEDESVLFIENVGNLVCPAGFDLGEAHKVVILSVTEGEDKPLKYPDMFAVADLVLISKIDLVPHLDFDLAATEANVLKVNPRAKILHVSSRTGEGMGAWIAWIEAARAMTFAGRATLAAPAL